MPIFDQGYQHWQGALSGHAWRWLAITRQGVRAQIKNRRTKWLVATAFMPALFLVAALVFWGLLEQQSSLLAPLMFFIQSLPEELRAGPKAYRTSFWTVAFDIFFQISTFFSMLLVLNVGPDLISQDLRFNAMPLYFSRPLRRLDYFLGKLGVIGVFLAAVTIGPVLFAYVLGVAFSLDATVVRDTGRLLAAAVGYGAIVVASAGTLMLAISSLTRSSRFVGAMWIGFWVLSNMGAGTLMMTVRQDWCPLVSYTGNLERVRQAMLDTDSARDQFIKLGRAGLDAGREAAQPRPRIFPFLRRRRREPPPPPPPPPPELAGLLVKPPWTWSAGVLAGLFVVSAWTLATRVKSLDRLR
jgi:ABC-2 type transport system permease protein